MSSNGTPNGQYDFIDDPEQWSQHARLSALEQAWEQALDRRDASEDSILSSDAGPQARAHFYRTGVQRLVFQLSSVATRFGATEIWEERPLGTVTLNVPDSIKNAMRDSSVRLLSGSDLPQPKMVEIRGLRELILRDWPLSESFEVYLAGSHGQPDVIRETSTAEPSIQMLDRAMMFTRELLGEAGVDLDLGAEDWESEEPGL